MSSIVPSKYVWTLSYEQVGRVDKTEGIISRKTRFFIIKIIFNLMSFCQIVNDDDVSELQQELQLSYIFSLMTSKNSEEQVWQKINSDFF